MCKPVRTLVIPDSRMPRAIRWLVEPTSHALATASVVWILLIGGLAASAQTGAEPQTSMDTVTLVRWKVGPGPDFLLVTCHQVRDIRGEAAPVYDQIAIHGPLTQAQAQLIRGALEVLMNTEPDFGAVAPEPAP